MTDFERLPSSRGVGGIAGGQASGQAIHAGAGLLGVPLYEPSVQQLRLDRGNSCPGSADRSREGIPLRGIISSAASNSFDPKCLGKRVCAS